MEAMRWFLGIDPGKHGGLALIGDDGSVKFHSMPETEEEVWEFIRNWGNSGTLTRVDPNYVGEVIAVIEKLGNSFHGSAKSSVGQLYGSYTSLRMALVAAGFREGRTFHAVPSARMWRALGIEPRRTTGDAEENRNEWKARLKRKAQQLFPRLKITLSTSDALLIAHYCRMTYGNPT